MVSLSFINVTDSCLCGVRVHYADLVSCCGKLGHSMIVFTRSHVTKHLGTVDTYPVEGRVGEDISMSRKLKGCT